jgi:tetratricopeptide (TPR) repeat protein
MADFNQAIKLDPTNARAHEERGTLKAWSADYRKGAVDDWSEAIRLGRKHPVLYAERGNAYLEEGKHDLAIADFDEAIRLGPGLGPSDEIHMLTGIPYSLPGLRTMRANAYAATGDPKRALVEYTLVINVDPSAWYAYAGRALAYEKTGQKEAAISDLRKLLSLRPSDTAKEELKRLGVLP